MPLPAFLGASNRRTKAPSGARIGIAIAGQLAHVAVLKSSGDGAQLQALEAIAIAQLSDLQAALSQLVKNLGLYRAPAVLSLSADYYRLHLTDSPKVPIEERNAALAFALRDVIDFPVAEAVIESFNLPPTVQRGGDRVYAVIAHSARLQPLAQAVSEAGLCISAIEIPELSVVNLLQRQEKIAATSAVLAQTTRGAALFLFVGEDLVLSRQLSGIADLRLFAEALENGGPPDQLLIEVQRTLDYFESQLARRPIARFYLQPMPSFLPAISAALTSNLNMPVQMLDCSALILAKTPGAAAPETAATVATPAATETPIAAPAAEDEELLMRGYLAIAAALREDSHATH